MVLTTILVLIAIMLLVFAIAVFSIGGTIGIIIFSDVIVCIFLLVWIIKKLFFKRR